MPQIFDVWGRLQHFIDAVRNLVEENYLKAQGSSSSWLRCWILKKFPKPMES